MTASYIHSYILWFSYAFKVCSKSGSEIRYICPMIVVGAVITHKMFNTGTKHLSAKDGQLSFPRSMWVKKFNLQITFMYIHFSHYANPPKCIVDTANICKTLWILTGETPILSRVELSFFFGDSYSKKSSSDANSSCELSVSIISVMFSFSGGLVNFSYSVTHCLHNFSILAISRLITL